MVSTAKVSQVMDDMHFPATKLELLRHAMDRNASAEVMEVLQRIDDRQYFEMDEVWDAIEVVEEAV